MTPTRRGDSDRTVVLRRWKTFEDGTRMNRAATDRGSVGFVDRGEVARFEHQVGVGDP